jgi:hypothetical protein
MTHIKLQIVKLINNFVLNAWLIIYFSELHHTCEIFIFERVTIWRYLSLNAIIWLF